MHIIHKVEIKIQH